MKLVAVVGGVALACLACASGRAADLPPVAPAPYRAAPDYIPAYFSWTGFYIGLEGGRGWGTTTFIDSFDATTTSVPLNGGFLLGGYTGVNYQVGSIVFGIEGDFTGAWVRGSAIDTLGDTESVNVFWTGLVTARLGWAFDRFLPYVKGGGAFLYHRDMISGPGPAGSPSNSSVASTWTLGGGVDWALTEHWIARGEYNYMRIPGKATFVALPPGTATVSGSFNEILGGIAYKF